MQVGIYLCADNTFVCFFWLRLLTGKIYCPDLSSQTLSDMCLQEKQLTVSCSKTVTVLCKTQPSGDGAACTDTPCKIHV